MADVKIEIRANGPNRVTGPIEIVDQSGNNYSIPRGSGFPSVAAGLRPTSPSATAGTGTPALRRPARPAKQLPRLSTERRGGTEARRDSLRISLTPRLFVSVYSNN